MKISISKLATMILAVLAVIAIGGWAVFSHGQVVKNSITQPGEPFVKRTGFVEAATPPIDFESAAEAGVPSVVHIKTLTKFKQTGGRGMQGDSPFDGFFGGDEMFKKFFGDGGSMARPEQKASGSGVILSSDGYIVTNNHVVDGASEISVTTNNRKSYEGKVVGTDPNTDLALIKIDAKDLPVMNIGNSDDVHLGQWVLAIGYPLNLDVTVTQGIVSAKSRNIGINQQGSAPVEAFIQTDAAVNPGSSGGALVNTKGELVGINAAIASPTGSYAGYAYSIPSNLMKKVIGDIMKFGAVQRGYLGVSMAPDDMDDATRKQLGAPDNINGVWVAETDPQGAASQAGIKKGDIITKIDGQSIETGAQLSEQVATHKPGDQVAISFTRGGQEQTVTATLKEKLGTFASQQEAAIKSLGATLETVSKAEAAQLNIAGGVKVKDIGDGVISDQTTMKPGFVITKVNDITVKSVEEFKAAIGKQASNFQIQGQYPGNNQVYFYGINDFRG
ncbi:trypsin-like peptidase domain-containing protein [Niabella sp. 22666]|uniref:trypsin-like peptidase domain-containing protein n=1 Tax=Niabella sp. 22666 TaxID=3453954 RepID=UPI003F83D5DF